MTPNELTTALIPHIGHLDAGALNWTANEFCYWGKEAVQSFVAQPPVVSEFGEVLTGAWANIDANGDGYVDQDEGFDLMVVAQIIGSNWDSFLVLAGCA